jgi:hypothetical protein
VNLLFQCAETVFGGLARVGQDGGKAKIELPESWAGVAEPLRALIAEVEREVHADGTASPDLAAVSARWAQVSDAVRATLRARIAEVQVAQSLAPKR